MRVTLRSIVYCLLGALAMAAFFDAGTLHGKYDVRAVGIRYVSKDELVFFVWYALWGGAATCAFAAMFFECCAERCVRKLEQAISSPREVIAIVGLFVFVAALLFRYIALKNEPIADDELVYQLTARNLVLGRVSSIPPIDPAFLENQFVVIDARRWHGKYPIGHSLLLAPFEALGRSDLLGPLLGCGSLWLTYAVGQYMIGRRRAVLAVLLLAWSPHFVWTHATLMSQATSSVAILAAIYASLRHSATTQVRWLVIMGACLGFGVLARPLPCVLVALVVLLGNVAQTVTTGTRANWRLAGRNALAWGPGLVFVAGVQLVANYVQSGSPWSSGYADVHRTYGAFQNIDGELTNSVGAAIVRENVWLFGWPMSLVLMVFARISHGKWLLWGVIGSGLAYRLLVPKTVVATTGPIYLTEIVPWLCLASADGAARLVGYLGQLGDARAKQRVAACMMGACCVALLGFFPVELGAVCRGAEARRSVQDELAEASAGRAVVFSELLVVAEDLRTWAYYPPNPWPDLRDDVLFFRIPRRRDGFMRAWQLWRDRFSDRPAFLFTPGVGGGVLRAFDPESPKLLKTMFVK